MIEEAIVHVGMHKTGSSSIQHTLHNLIAQPDSAVGYLKLNSPNHSEFLMTLLSERPEEYHSHRLNGRTVAEVQEIKQQHEQQFKAAISAFCGRVILISGEDLSAPGVNVNMLTRLKELLLNHCHSVRIIGYARPPVAYMQSAFQQRLKGGVQRDFKIQGLWPHYRKRFETLDQVFGKENVEIVLFKPELLYQNDVVLDFARRVGFILKEEDQVRTNESISLEACAVLFTLRKLEKALPYAGYTVDNNRLVATVSDLGKGKLTLATELVQPVLQANQADLEWINQRLGHSIEDKPREASNNIVSEGDLLEIAVSQGDALWDMLEKESLNCNGEPSTSQLVDRLSLLTANGPLYYQELGVSKISDFLNKSDPALLLEKAANLFTHVEPEVASTFQRMIGPAKTQKKRLLTDTAVAKTNISKAH